MLPKCLGGSHVQLGVPPGVELGLLDLRLVVGVALVEDHLAAVAPALARANRISGDPHLPTAKALVGVFHADLFGVSLEFWCQVELPSRQSNTVLLTQVDICAFRL